MLMRITSELRATRSLVGTAALILLLSLLTLSLSTLWAVPGLAQDDEDCLMCHDDPSIFEDLPNAAELVVDLDVLSKSVHMEMGLSCIDCHGDLDGFDDFPHADVLEPVDCSMCHEEAAEHFRGSLHGSAGARGNEKAPSCESCHGTHDIRYSSDPESPTHKANLPVTCAVCHGTPRLLEDTLVKLPQSFTDYANSVHGRGVGQGIATAASCDDCHEVHDLKSKIDPDSPINPLNVSKTCSQCHPDIMLAYEQSIHGRALAMGVTDSPTCTDCHGEHLILSPSNPAAPTHSSRIAKETCGHCHEDPVLNAKYGMMPHAVETYMDSYHGWATARHSDQAATCTSCHSTHAILPASDPQSTIHADRVTETCQQCHPRADHRFAASYTHASASISLNPINRIIRKVYIALIWFIIGGMVLHNLVIINFFMFESRKKQSRSRWVLRFDRQEIIQHMLLTISFTALVITGFALRYPDAWWVQQSIKLGLTESLRGNIHRISAILMLLTSFYHTWYLFFTRRGRGQFKAMAPGTSDFSEFFTNMRFFTWISKDKPRFGHFDYSQKAEYWALIWGTIIMILTGFVLWFPDFFVRFLPPEVVSASQVIHFYEAWLATLAILVWHFFFVAFHPEEYPMSWTWLTGKMSEDSAKKHHLRWYEDEVLKQDGLHEADETLSGK